MSQHFQELGRLHRSSGHTQSPSSPVVTCFIHSECSDPAVWLILTHPIRLYNYTTYSTGLIRSQFRQWLLRWQDAAWHS